jgi:hypothetical protein
MNPVSQHAARLVGVRYGKIRRLSGFRSGHRVPDAHFDSAGEFVRRIGEQEVRIQAEQLHAGLRSTFALKRRELVYVCEAGAAAIKTPGFEVGITLEQSPHDPADYALQTEVAGFATLETLLQPGFSSLFDPWCNELQLEFAAVLPLEDKIDAIEANEKLAPFLDYEADCSSFTLTFSLPSLRLKATPHSLCFSIPGERNLQRLLEQSIPLLEQWHASFQPVLE